MYVWLCLEVFRGSPLQKYRYLSTYQKLCYVIVFLKNIINTYVKHLYCIFIKLMEYSTLCYILPNYIPLFGVSLLILFLYTYIVPVIPGYFTVIIGVLPRYLLPRINLKKTFLHFCPFSKFCRTLYFEKSSNTIKKSLV